MDVEFSVRGLEKSFDGLPVLAGVSLAVERDAIVAVLGPSACGKTTLLSILAGLVKGDAGEIEGLRGKPISYMFQEPRLLDWLTVAENIAFVLEDLFPADQVRERTRAHLERMELLGYQDYYPRRLSGGQKQRVAMARALAYPSRILFLDEPFKSLDLGLKLDLIDRFLEHWATSPRTVVCVTHDIKEALLLADRVVVLAGKPAMLRGSREIGIPRRERLPNNPALLAIEGEIAGELLGSR